MAFVHSPSRIINPLARERRFGFGSGVGSAAAFAGPLDAYATPVAAWSLYRRLRSSYTGPLIRLRKASGGESDFSYVDATGIIDTAAITTWAGGSGMFLVTEYDQSGNGRDRTQATAGTQPAFTLTGGPASGIPKIDGSDGAKYVQTAGGLGYASNDFTWLVVGSPVNNFRSNLWARNAAGSRGDFLGIHAGTTLNAIRINGSYTFVTGTSTGWRVQTCKRATNSIRFCADAAGATGSNSTALDVDNYRSGDTYTCEAIVWHSALSDADQDAIHANARTAFSL